MKVLVLGGSGFLGSHVCDHLFKLGIHTTIYDLKKTKFKNKNQKMIKGNILNLKRLSNTMKKIDTVFNFAGFSDLDSSIKDPLGTAKHNILGTINILLACQKNNVKKFIHASSIYANTEEGSFYASSKKAAEDYIERYCRNNKINFSIL